MSGEFDLEGYRRSAVTLPPSVLRLSLAKAAIKRDAAAAVGRDALAGLYAEVAEVLAQTLDNRVALEAAIAEAMNPFGVVGDD